MANTDLFAQINNAILDLQNSEFQSFNRPLILLGRLLRHPDLAAVNATLTEGLALDAFLASQGPRGGMLGSDRISWPSDGREALGITLLLILKFGDDPNFITDFGHTYFYSGSKIIGAIHSVTSQVIVPFWRDYKAYVQSRGAVEPKLILGTSNKIFIVHGREDGPREAVARFLERLKFEPIILNERANRGMTLIEKVEAHSDVGFAVVLLTPDDRGFLKGEEPQDRARQNVVLELGYFVGKLSRERVCVLQHGDLELPSDWHGIVDESFDDKGTWKQVLGRELAAVGYEIDWNTIMR